jgi:lipopolysaccharide/colanic/teichoic acid biosynthesis glycosyltransferase
LSIVTKKKLNGFLIDLPKVFKGRMSLVGPPQRVQRVPVQTDDSLFLGKSGICGLIQLQQDRILSNDEIDQYNLYYARNQSVLLDLEILIKTWLRYRSWRKNTNGK